MQRDTNHPTGLPPVRKRKTYSDVSSDALTFALYHDRIAGDGDAMSEAGEWQQSADQVAVVKALIAETVALVEQVKALGLTTDARDEL